MRLFTLHTSETSSDSKFFRSMQRRISRRRWNSPGGWSCSKERRNNMHHIGQENHPIYNITPIYPYLNSIIVLQSFAKCYKQKSSANCRHPSVVSIFQMHYLPLVVSTLLVLRIKLWKLTEYRRIVYLEPHQQLNFCSFATKCTGAHDLHFVLTISPVIWFDACAWAWPACPEDADILVHRPIDELFALPETHLKILYSDDKSLYIHVNCVWLHWDIQIWTLNGEIYYENCILDLANLKESRRTLLVSCLSLTGFCT